MVTLIEIAVYAALLSGGVPMVCLGHEHETVMCSTGLSAKMVTEQAIGFSDGTLIDRDEKGFPRMTNDARDLHIHSWFGSAGWLTFSNGMQIRRMNPDLYKIGKDLECKAVEPNKVECSKIQDKEQNGL